ncbi:hypothetical protein ABBQ38_010414 [Trebouxia sp. C0009 RCD-2024]
MSDSARAGPSNQAAAVVMGYSVKQGDKRYDMHYHPRLAQNAVDGVQSWRTAMMQSYTPAAPDLTLSLALWACLGVRVWSHGTMGWAFEGLDMVGTWESVPAFPSSGMWV